MADPLADPRSSETGLKAGLRYPSPFFDIASLFIPPRLKDLFKFCQLYAFSDEIISATIYKLAQFPITDFIYGTKDDDFRDRWKSVLEDDLAIRTRLEEAGLDYYTYGNYIASFYIPFARFLVCPHCKKQKPIQSTKFHFKINDFRFYSKCPTCSPDELIPFYVQDKPLTRTTKGMNIVRWDPSTVDIEYNPISGNSSYYYNLPNQFKRQIWAGRRKVLEETPMSFIMAAKEGARVELDTTNLIHIRRPSFSYFDNGWGMPLVVPLLKSKFYFQILLKAREAILQQHIIPMWMLYPLPQANLDPHGHLAMARWRSEIESAVKKWRRDPNYIATFPIPTGFQQIGGDAKALSVIEEMRFLQDTMIVGLQVPREFLLGGASWSGSSVTFRMLENFFMNHVRGLRQLVRFVVEKVSLATKLKKVDISMTRLRWVDDIQQKSLLMQANAQGKVSDDTFVSEVGHIMSKEYEKMLEEVDSRSKIMVAQAKAQAEAEGEAMLVQMQYQQKAQMEMAKAQKDLMAELRAAGYSPEQIQAMMLQTQVQQPAGGQFTPGGVLQKEPNKPGVSQGGQPALNPEMWAGQFASTIMQAGETERERMLMDLQLRDPQLHMLVQQKIMEIQGIDQRPNPDQRPPTRHAGRAPTPSKV